MLNLANELRVRLEILFDVRKRVRLGRLLNLPRTNVFVHLRKTWWIKAVKFVKGCLANSINERSVPEVELRY